jgi:molecular chaperone Hsp33
MMTNEVIDSWVEVRCYFVRKRNALLVRGKVSSMFMDYFLHLMEYHLKNSAKMDDLMKDALTGMVLHLSSRPHDEACAWTIHLEDPAMNLFVAGSSRDGHVTGRVFEKDIKKTDKNLFIAQSVRNQQGSRQSMIDFSGSDIHSAIEQFYTQSEQRMTRIFQLEDEDYLQISAEPDCDLEWLKSLSLQDVIDLDKVEELSLLEQRSYRFYCGCEPEKLYPLIDRLPDEDIEFVFADGVAKINCPRCAAEYHIKKQVFFDWKDSQNLKS